MAVVLAMTTVMTMGDVQPAFATASSFAAGYLHEKRLRVEMHHAHMLGYHFWQPKPRTNTHGNRSREDLASAVG